eukprot:gene26428-32424_t
MGALLTAEQVPPRGGEAPRSGAVCITDPTTGEEIALPEKPSSGRAVELLDSDSSDFDSDAEYGSAMPERETEDGPDASGAYGVYSQHELADYAPPSMQPTLPSGGYPRWPAGNLQPYPEPRMTSHAIPIVSPTGQGSLPRSSNPSRRGPKASGEGIVGRRQQHQPHTLSIAAAASDRLQLELQAQVQKLQLQSEVLRLTCDRVAPAVTEVIISYLTPAQVQKVLVCSYSGDSTHLRRYTVQALEAMHEIHHFPQLQAPVSAVSVSTAATPEAADLAELHSQVEEEEVTLVEPGAEAVGHARALPIVNPATGEAVELKADGPKTAPSDAAGATSPRLDLGIHRAQLLAHLRARVQQMTCGATAWGVAQTILDNLTVEQVLACASCGDNSFLRLYTKQAVDAMGELHRFPHLMDVTPRQAVEKKRAAE